MFYIICVCICFTIDLILQYNVSSYSDLLLQHVQSMYMIKKTVHTQKNVFKGKDMPSFSDPEQKDYMAKTCFENTRAPQNMFFER